MPVSTWLNLAVVIINLIIPQFVAFELLDEESRLAG